MTSIRSLIATAALAVTVIAPGRARAGRGGLRAGEAREAALAHGFLETGPLRVWRRPGEGAATG